MAILIHIPDEPQASPDQAGTYQVAVSIQRLRMQSDHWGNAQLVKVRCVQRNVHEYSLVFVLIKFQFNLEEALLSQFRGDLL